MIIKNLKLKNYRRFSHLELELPENLIGIVGNNGIGKTTIVEAIGWVLYGNRIKRTDKQDIRSQFCDNNDICSVEMEFISGGNEYRIIRQLKGKTAIAEAALYCNGNPEPVAVQERGVNDFIEQMLNLDYRSFFVSVFARQKDLAALSLLQPEERRRSIARLINIDAIERARKEIRADKNKNEAIKEGMLTNIKDEKTLKKQKNEFKDRLQQQTEKETIQKGEVSKILNLLQNAKSEFEAINELRDRFLHLKAQLEKWELRQSDFQKREQKQIDQINVIKKAETELKELQNELADYDTIKQEKEHLDQLSIKQATLNAKGQERQRIVQLIEKKKIQSDNDKDDLKSFSDKREAIEKIELELTNFEQQRESARLQLTAAQAQKEKTTVLGKEIRQRKEKVDKLGKESPCPVCTRPLGEHYSDVISHFNEELEALRLEWKKHSQVEDDLINRINECDARLKTIKENRDQLFRAQEQYTERLKSFQKIEAELNEWKETLNNILSEIEKLGKIEYDEKHHQELKQKYHYLTTLHERALKFEENVRRLPEVEEELEQTKKILADLKNDILTHKEELSNLKYDEQEFQNVKKKVEQLQKQHDEARNNLEAVQREMIILKKDLEKIEEELENQKQLLRNIKELENQLHYLAALEQHFGIFRQELAGRIRPVIAHRASELISLTTNSRYSILELDEDYNIFLYDRTERYPLARFSGGEQDLANLCLRIAISQVVAERSGGTQINFIVLDEIFGSQDEERKELIMNTLQHLSSQFRQIFVITHVEEIKDIMPVVISVEEKEFGESIARLL